MADVAEEYRSSLSELNFNSKPHINMLTMLAEENLQHAPIIVKTIVDHINSVTPELKLPSLYLVDSIVKNVGQLYTSLFSKHLVELFTSVFDKVDENIRSLLFKLRSTWTGIFPSAVLLDLDKSVTNLDPAWPVPQQSLKNIHVNPLFLDKPGLDLPKKTETLSKSQSALVEVEMKKQQLVLLKALEEKKKKLMELRLQAALAPVESAKADIQKKLNARDPRLYKKVSPAAVTDSATLQSVIVIPKENVKRRNEKGALSPVSKKNKLDYVPYSSKKDGKTKPAGFAVNSKVNAAQNASNQQGNSTHAINSQEGMKSLKQPSEHGVSALGHSELGKSEHLSKYPADLKTRSDGILLNKPGVSLNQSNESVTKILGSVSHSIPKSNLSEEKNYCYNQQPTLITKEDVKETPKLEPPPLPPLFLGNEDKDYRILPKNFDDRNLNDTPYHKRMYSFINAVDKNNFSFKRNMHERNVYSKQMQESSWSKHRIIYPYKKSTGNSSNTMYNNQGSDLKNQFQCNSLKGQSLPVVKSFKLDGKERKVYFVNERSFAFLDDNIPRELTFEGAPQFVFIEGLPQPIELGFRGHEVKFEIDGKFHFLKFGTPAREVYIDDYPYEASFGGPPVTFLLENGKVCRIRISGSVPNVVLSKTPAYDLYDRFCQSNREFLQRFDNEPNINHGFSLVPNHDVDMRVNNGKFSSAFFDFPLEKINDVNWQRIHVGNSQQTEWNVPKNSFETFKDVNPSFISQGNYSKESDWNMPPPLPPKQMINRFPGMPSPATYGCSYGSVNKPLQQFSSEFPRSSTPNNGPFSQPKNSTGPQLTEASAIPKLTPPPLPPFLSTIPNTSCMTGLAVTKDLVQTSESYCNSTVPSTFSLTQTVVALPPMNATPIPMTGLNTSVLATNTVVSSHMLSSAVPAQVPIINVSQQTAASTTSVGQNTGPVNMNLILDQLVAAGIIGKNSGTSTSPPASAASAELEKTEDDNIEDSPKEDSLPEIVFESKCLKEFYPGVISALHNGSQCATCGMRFKEIQSDLQYRRHLDWHFRRNQREKYGAKKPCSRRLFYEIKDWIQFKEFEDVDERAPSYFELQANGEQASVPSPEIVCSVACSDCESENCAVCGEQFQLFWVEEEEEWHLKNAVKHNDQVYHPSCYEDYEKANNPVVNDPESSFEETKTDLKTEITELDEEEVSPTEVKDENIEEDLKENEGESGDKMETDNDENEKEENSVVVNEEKINKDEEKFEDEGMELEAEVKETEVVIKVEPMEIEEVGNIEVKEEKPITDSETTSTNSETTKTEELKSEIKAEPVEEPAVKAEDTNEESVLASQSENVPPKSEDELDDIEFQPPTPDPRFEVLPPVSRGTEISNLCTIM